MAVAQPFVLSEQYIWVNLNMWSGPRALVVGFVQLTVPQALLYWVDGDDIILLTGTITIDITQNIYVKKGILGEIKKVVTNRSQDNHDFANP